MQGLVVEVSRDRNLTFGELGASATPGVWVSRDRNLAFGEKSPHLREDAGSPTSPATSQKGTAVSDRFHDPERPSPAGNAATRTPPQTLNEPGTPFLAVDLAKVRANIARLTAHLDMLGVPLRLHVKTCKAPEIARLAFGGKTGPITVSTLGEADAFAADGFTDMIYAVGIAPAKLPRISALRARGVDIAVLLDSTAQAEAVATASRDSGHAIPALIEIDCDGHRGGLLPGDPTIGVIASILARGGAELRGVLTHAGESYFADGAEELAAAAEAERAAVVGVAEELRREGYAVPVVSVGSTPTGHSVRDLTGVTEVRAGNFVFFDLVQAGIGVCGVEDIALFAVATVIGHRPERGWILTDAGWTATSRDRGTAAQAVDQGYGVVTDLAGHLYPDLVMSAASQEHGTLTVREGSAAQLPDLPIGTRVRILPNHACAMAEEHAEYVAVDGGTGVVARIARPRGW